MPVPMVTTHGQEPYKVSDSLKWTKVVCLHVRNISDYSENPTSLENNGEYSECEYNDGTVQTTPCKMAKSRFIT